MLSVQELFVGTQSLLEGNSKLERRPFGLIFPDSPATTATLKLDQSSLSTSTHNEKKEEKTISIDVSSSDDEELPVSQSWKTQLHVTPAALPSTSTIGDDSLSLTHLLGDSNQNAAKPDSVVVEIESLGPTSSPNPVEKKASQSDLHSMLVPTGNSITTEMDFWLAGGYKLPRVLSLENMMWLMRRASVATSKAKAKNISLSLAQEALEGRSNNDELKDFSDALSEASRSRHLSGDLIRIDSALTCRYGSVAPDDPYRVGEAEPLHLDTYAVRVTFNCSFLYPTASVNDHHEQVPDRLQAVSLRRHVGPGRRYFPLPLSVATTSSRSYRSAAITKTENSTSTSTAASQLLPSASRWIHTLTSMVSRPHWASLQPIILPGEAASEEPVFKGRRFTHPPKTCVSFSGYYAPGKLYSTVTNETTIFTNTQEIAPSEVIRTCALHASTAADAFFTTTNKRNRDASKPYPSCDSRSTTAIIPFGCFTKDALPLPIHENRPFNIYRDKDGSLFRKAVESLDTDSSSALDPTTLHRERMLYYASCAYNVEDHIRKDIGNPLLDSNGNHRIAPSSNGQGSRLFIHRFIDTEAKHELSRREVNSASSSPSDTGVNGDSAIVYVKQPMRLGPLSTAIPITVLAAERLRQGDISSLNCSKATMSQQEAFPKLNNEDICALNIEPDAITLIQPGNGLTSVLHSSAMLTTERINRLGYRHDSLSHIPAHPRQSDRALPPTTHSSLMTPNTNVSPSEKAVVCSLLDVPPFPSITSSSSSTFALAPTATSVANCTAALFASVLRHLHAVDEAILCSTAIFNSAHEASYLPFLSRSSALPLSAPTVPPHLRLKKGSAPILSGTDIANSVSLLSDELVLETKVMALRTLYKICLAHVQQAVIAKSHPVSAPSINATELASLLSVDQAVTNTWPSQRIATSIKLSLNPLVCPPNVSHRSALPAFSPLHTLVGTSRIAYVTRLLSQFVINAAFAFTLKPRLPVLPPTPASTSSSQSAGTSCPISRYDPRLTELPPCLLPISVFGKAESIINTSQSCTIMDTVKSHEVSIPIPADITSIQLLALIPPPPLSSCEDLTLDDTHPFTQCGCNQNCHNKCGKGVETIHHGCRRSSLALLLLTEILKLTVDGEEIINGTTSSRAVHQYVKSRGPQLLYQHARSHVHGIRLPLRSWVQADNECSLVIARALEACLSATNIAKANRDPFFIETLLFHPLYEAFKSHKISDLDGHTLSGNFYASEQRNILVESTSCYVRNQSVKDVSTTEPQITKPVLALTVDESTTQNYQPPFTFFASPIYRAVGSAARTRITKALISLFTNCKWLLPSNTLPLSSARSNSSSFAILSPSAYHYVRAIALSADALLRLLYQAPFTRIEALGTIVAPSTPLTSPSLSSSSSSRSDPTTTSLTASNSTSGAYTSILPAYLAFLESIQTSTLLLEPTGGPFLKKSRDSVTDGLIEALRLVSGRIIATLTSHFPPQSLQLPRPSSVLHTVSALCSYLLTLRSSASSPSTTMGVSLHNRLLNSISPLRQSLDSAIMGFNMASIDASSFESLPICPSSEFSDTDRLIASCQFALFLGHTLRYMFISIHSVLTRLKHQDSTSAMYRSMIDDLESLMRELVRMVTTNGIIHALLLEVAYTPLELSSPSLSQSTPLSSSSSDATPARSLPITPLRIIVLSLIRGGQSTKELALSLLNRTFISVPSVTIPGFIPHQRLKNIDLDASFLPISAPRVPLDLVRVLLLVLSLNVHVQLGGLDEDGKPLITTAHNPDISGPFGNFSDDPSHPSPLSGPVIAKIPSTELKSQSSRPSAHGNRSTLLLPHHQLPHAKRPSELGADAFMLLLHLIKRDNQEALGSSQSSTTGGMSPLLVQPDSSLTTNTTANTSSNSGSGNASAPPISTPRNLRTSTSDGSSFTATESIMRCINTSKSIDLDEIRSNYSDAYGFLGTSEEKSTISLDTLPTSGSSPGLSSHHQVSPRSMDATVAFWLAVGGFKFLHSLLDSVSNNSPIIPWISTLISARALSVSLNSRIVSVSLRRVNRRIQTVAADSAQPTESFCINFLVSTRTHGNSQTQQLTKLAPTRVIVRFSMAKADTCRSCDAECNKADSGVLIALNLPSAKHFCANASCLRVGLRMCTRIHNCGHRCYGNAGEPICPPCLNPECLGILDQKINIDHETKIQSTTLSPAHDENSDCSICYTELKRLPISLINCGHIFHTSCLTSLIRSGTHAPDHELQQSPKLVFNHIKCPLCQTDINHTDSRGDLSSCIEKLAAPIRALHSAVKSKAVRHARGLRVLEKIEEEIHRKVDIQMVAKQQSKTPFANEREMKEEREILVKKGLSDALLRRYNFYLCHECAQPYCGGEARCDIGIEPAPGDGNGQGAPSGPTADNVGGVEEKEAPLPHLVHQSSQDLAASVLEEQKKLADDNPTKTPDPETVDPPGAPTWAEVLKATSMLDSLSQSITNCMFDDDQDVLPAVLDELKSQSGQGAPQAERLALALQLETERLQRKALVSQIREMRLARLIARERAERVARKANDSQNNPIIGRIRFVHNDDLTEQQRLAKVGPEAKKWAFLVSSLSLSRLYERRYDPCDFHCGACTIDSTTCHTHGKDYIQWKCRYCCAPAVWYCFGSTHFCDPCHQNHRTLTRMTKDELDKLVCPVIPATSRPYLPAHHPDKPCPLGGHHAPAGEEECLGCMMCRSSADTKAKPQSSSAADSSTSPASSDKPPNP